MSSKRIIVYLLLAFLAGIGVDNALSRNGFPYFSRIPAGYIQVRKDFGYKMIDPLLMCNTPQDAPDNADIAPFKKVVEEKIKRDLKAKWPISVGVYFRDLSCGHWFSLGSDERFEPASLMKVPLMISILREADTNPAILRRSLRFKVPQDLYSVQRTRPPALMKQGNFYRVDDLLFRMIAYSDNNATYLLEDVVKPELREEMFSDMHIDSPYKNTNGEAFVTVDQYAAFFSILYNASYLSKEMSEKALLYLANTTYSRGLVDGVPGGVMVAHKFGERLDEKDQTKYLSDCGIVYFPQNPYLICVMTKGPEFGPLQDAIRDISQTVFQKVSNGYHQDH